MDMRSAREGGRRGSHPLALVEIALKKSRPRKLNPTLIPVVPSDMATTPASISHASFFCSDSTQNGLAIWRHGEGGGRPWRSGAC